MIDHIKKYIDDDEYYQILFTIVTKFIGKQDELKKMLQEAEDHNLKIYIDDEDMSSVQWDYINLEMIKMK